MNAEVDKRIWGKAVDVIFAARALCKAHAEVHSSIELVTPETMAVLLRRRQQRFVLLAAALNELNGLSTALALEPKQKHPPGGVENAER